jgi:hypothetical protein
MRIPGHETCHSEVIAIVDSELMTIKNPADFATGDRHQLGMSDFSSSESAVKVRLAPVNQGHSWGLGAPRRRTIAVPAAPNHTGCTHLQRIGPVRAQVRPVAPPNEVKDAHLTED